MVQIFRGHIILYCMGNCAFGDHTYGFHGDDVIVISSQGGMNMVEIKVMSIELFID